MSKSKRTSVVIGMTEFEKEELLKQAKEMNVSVSGLGRMAFAHYKEDGCNEPIVMNQFIQLTQKINELENKIPSEEYNYIQKLVGNIMTVKGGK